MLVFSIKHSHFSCSVICHASHDDSKHGRSRTSRGSSASQMMAAKVIHVIARSHNVFYLPRTRFSHAHYVSVLVPACCHSFSRLQPLSRTDPTQMRGSRAHCLCFPKHRHTSSRNVIRYTSLDLYTGHVHSFLIFDTIFLKPLSARTNPVQVHDII